MIDPYRVLGVTPEASTETMRATYLELVRQHPPDRDADRFREIHQAYQLICDPLAQATALFESWQRVQPDLSQIVAQGSDDRCRLSTLCLLALGNQDEVRSE